ncbi:MAG: helix-turn-helix transcriptional regulator [Candidatus Dormibacteraeota bacterium]|nr:helix-turn-helix transcriptional regulator [Candidatus Dormibacteraeota bacterium]
MTAPIRPSIVRSDFSTSDALEAREVIDQVYGGRLRVGRVRDGDLRVRVNQMQAAGIVSTDLDLPVDLFFEIAGRDQYTFTTMLDGIAEFDRDQDTERFAAGDVYLAIYPGDSSLCHTGHAHARTINLPASLLAEVAGDGSDEPPRNLRFRSHQPAAGGARQWRQVTRFVDGLLAEPEVAGARLIVGPAARLLAATALAIFPNDAVTEPTPTDRHDANPDTLRRAIAFIEANPDRDITLLDIARAASVTTRAVQLAFRRQLNTTPMAYLRRVRLHHAHQQLQQSTPDDGLTVTRVALDWGFPNPSRFAALYRAAYGRLPSHSLRA